MKIPSIRAFVAGALAALATLSSGCGGTDGGVSVTNLSAENIEYFRTMTVSVSGRLLTEGATLTSDGGCDNIVLASGGTAELLKFTCKLTAAGRVSVRVRNAANQTLGSMVVDVPLPQVTINTSKGAFVVELDPTKAPLTVNNFLTYVTVTNSFYDSTIFHQVINDQLIAGGGYTSGLKMKAATNPAIALESGNGLKNLRGTIAMSHDVGAPDSATSLFFINTKDNPEFDRQDDANPGYAVFGTVVSGLAVIDQIKAVETTSRLIDGTETTLTDVPVTDVRITSARQTR